jgi:Na+-transporting NADH:ubiquinone oxidoreductase subunit B
MEWLRRWLDGLRPRFAKGGPYERFYVLYEMVDGFLFSMAFSSLRQT